jgi:hypothetical protein
LKTARTILLPKHKLTGRITKMGEDKKTGKANYVIWIQKEYHKQIAGLIGKTCLITLEPMTGEDNNNSNSDND